MVKKSKKTRVVPASPPVLRSVIKCIKLWDEGRVWLETVIFRVRMSLKEQQTFSCRFLLLWWVFLHRTSVTPNDSIDKGFVVAHQPSRSRYQCCFFGGGTCLCWCVWTAKTLRSLNQSDRSVRFTGGDADNHISFWRFWQILTLKMALWSFSANQEVNWGSIFKIKREQSLCSAGGDGSETPVDLNTSVRWMMNQSEEKRN